MNKRKYKAIPVINTDQTPFGYERKIYNVGDTARRSSFEIYPPIRSSFEIYPPLKDAARSPGTPQDSQVSLDLSTIEYALCPFSLVSKRPGLSHIAPSTPKQELRRSRGSHVTLDLTEMESQSLSAPPSSRKETKERRYRFTSHVSLDLSQVEPEFLSSQQAPRETSEIFLSQTESRALTSTSSQVCLDFSYVEPDLAVGKYESQSMSLPLSEDSPKPSSSAEETSSSYAENSHASTEESEVQLLPQALKHSLNTHESAKAQLKPVSSKQSVWSALSEDLPKPSSSAKESTSSIAETLQASTEESEILFLPQEDSSDDSDDTTQEPETSTPRERFPSFGRKKKKSSSRGETTRRDSVPQTESGVFPVPSTQQENASAITDQSMIIDRFLCSTELETSQVTGDETLAEGFISEVNYNEEKLEKASSRLTESGESVIRSEDRTIESKEIEDFEQDDKINLSTECAEYSAPLMDDSKNSVPGISGCLREDVRPLRQSEPCVALSDSNIQVCGEFTSSTLAATTSSVSHTLPSSGSQLSLQSSERRAASTSSFSRKRAVESTAQSQASGFEESEVQFIPQALIQRSESLGKASLKAHESANVESMPVSSNQSPGSALSEDSPKRSSSTKESTSSIGDSLHGSTEESEVQFISQALFQRSESVRKASLETHESAQVESTPVSSKQSPGSALSEDSPKLSSSAKEPTSSIAETSQASTEESEILFIPQEDSSGDSDDTTQEPETSTPRERFPSFGGKKKTSSSRGEITRPDSLPETELGGLPVPSTQQENASAITDQSMIIERFPCSTELETRQVTGDKTFSEGFINEVNYNEERLEKASSRLTESGESVIRSEAAPIESKEIEAFEQEDNINLATKCAQYSAPFMDDSKNSVPEISGDLKEDVRPLRQSKPCVALSDSNIQVYGEFTSSAIAATTSSVSHPLPSSRSPLPLESSERRAASTSSFSRKRAVESTAQSQASGFEVSEVQFIPQALIQRSKSLGKASLKAHESAKIESTPASSKQSPESALSEDSPKPSSSGKESTSSIGDSLHGSTEESEVQFISQTLIQRSESGRKASLKAHESANVESTPVSSKQSLGSALSEDSPKRSSSTKEPTSSIAEISQGSTEESEILFLPQEDSSGDSDDTTQEPETCTPRERFPLFGRKKKKSSSHGETTRRDSLPEIESGVLPVPSTQQENSSAITDQSMIIERFPCSTELETRQVTGDKTFAEGFINEVNYNEEKLEKASSRLTKSGESVIRSEDRTIESKDIEDFEQEDNITLSTKCAEFSAPFMDDSKNSVPGISGSLRDDVRPLLQSKPCVVLSDSNGQVCGESTSATLAATTSSVSHPLPSSGSQLSLQSSERRAASTSSFSSKRAVESTAQSQASGFEVSEVQFIPQALIQRSESWGKASLKVHESAKIESTPASSKPSPGSALSEDSPKPSSSGKESTSSTSETSHASTDESEVQFIPQVLLQRSESMRKATLILHESANVESTPVSSNQSPASALSEDFPKPSLSGKESTSSNAETSHASTEESEVQFKPQTLLPRTESVREVSLKAHESAKVESTPVSSKHSVWTFSEDSPKQSSSAKESTSSIAETSQASTEESEILFIPPEHSSNNSDDTTQQPETSTPRDRFPLFGRKKKESSSRGQTTRSDSLPETESSVLPVPSTQQENVSVITAQSVIIDRFPCSAELETRRGTGDETLAEGFIDEVNDNGEKLQRASSRVTESGESVIRSEDRTIESKEIEAFEQDDNINLSTGCAEYSAPIMDDSKNSVPGIYGSLRDDVRLLLQSKPCVVLSDSNIQLCGESTSSPLAATTSSVCHPLPSSGSQLSLQSSERRAASMSSFSRKHAVESTAQSQASGLEESEVQFIPQALIQRSESVHKASLKAHESRNVDSTPVSSKESLGSALSKDSPKPSSSGKESTSSIAETSHTSTEVSEVQFIPQALLQRSENVRKASPKAHESAKVESTPVPSKHSVWTFSEDSPKQSSLGKEWTSSNLKTSDGSTDESEVQFIPQAFLQRSENVCKSSLKTHESAKLESMPVSSNQSPGNALSEDSPKLSSSSKEPISRIAESSHTSTEESEVQFIPQALLQRSESVRKASLETHESAKVESTPVSSNQSSGSALSEDSSNSSSSRKESTSSIAETSHASTEESEILFIPQEDSSDDSDDTTQEPETSTPRERFPSFGRKKKRSLSRGQTTRRDSLPDTESGVLPVPSTQQKNALAITDQSMVIDRFPCSTDSETRQVTGDETLAEGFIDEVNDDGEKFEKASGRKRAAELTAQSQASAFEESEIQFISHALMQRSEIVPKTSLKTQESAAIMTESAQVRFELGGMEHESQLTSQSSSEDSHTSSGGSKGDIDLKRDVVSSTSSFDTDQGSGVEFLSADESLRRKGFQSLKPDALEVITKYKSRVMALLSSASSEDDSVPLHQRSIEDLGESQSSYTKLKPVQSKIPRIPLKMKKALKISTSEKQHKLYSKFPQEDSSDDTTQEPETSTSRKRFPLFGRTKGKSSSRGPTTRRDSLPEPESGVLPVPSTQQEHAQVITDQSAITYRFPCSAELETRQVTGDETLAEGFIDVGNDNGEKLEKTSSRLTESGESVMRSEDATIESKEIEDFEHEDNIDLFTECAEYLVPVMDDSKNLFPEISGSSREDVRPLLHSKPCKVLSDSNIQVCGESTSSTLASTTSSVSYPLPSSGSRLSLQPSERREASTCSFSRKRAVGSTAQSQTSGFEESEIQFIPQTLIQRSESVCKTSLKKQESAAIITESAQVSLELGGMRHESQLASQSSSEDSHTSSGGSKGDIDLTRNVASSTSSIDTQSSSVEFFSADESFRRKSLRSLKPDALELTAKHQSRGVKLLSSESFEDASLPPHQRCIEDLGESQSPYTKLKPVQSKIPRIPLKVKKAFKFSTSEKQHKLFSKFPQEGSSDDSDDTTQEPKHSTPRRRFSLFGRRKNRSSSRVQTTRRDSLPETESGVLPVPSTQQENAPVFTGKSAITDRFPCSTELETRQVTGDETLAKGFIDLANDNGEDTHDNAVDVSSSGLQNPEVSSTRTKQQETSHEDFGMLVSSMDNPPHGEDASM